MPNHVTNRICAPKEVIDRLVNNGGGVDFNCVIPMPQCLRSGDAKINEEAIAKAVVSGTPIEEAVKAEQISARTPDYPTIHQYISAFKETGYMNWYHWSCANWGTKWNAYDVERVSGGEVMFRTAWAAPHPVIERLVAETGTGLTHEWADEDLGNNVGRREYNDTGDYCEEEMSRTREGMELALELKGLEDEYVLIDGEYVWKEDLPQEEEGD
jgi:hypothetical protein